MLPNFHKREQIEIICGASLRPILKAIGVRSECILKAYRTKCWPGTCFLWFWCPCVAQGATHVKMRRRWRCQVAHLDLKQGRVLMIFAPSYDFEAHFVDIVLPERLQMFRVMFFKIVGFNEH